MSDDIQNPDLWVEIYQTSPAGSDVYRYQQSTTRDPSTYYGGWKEPRVMEIGDVERASSNVQGHFESSRVSIVVRDTDRVNTARLDDEERQVLAGAEMVVRFISHKGRRALVTPRTLFRGPCREYGESGEYDFSVVCEDILGAKFGPFGLDKRLPPLTFGVDFALTAPKDLLKEIVPGGVYGVWDDFGTALATGEPFEVGMLPAYYAGDMVTTSTQVIPPSQVTGSLTLPPPPAPTYTKFGSGGSYTYTYAFVARTNLGGKTTLGGMTTITGLPRPQDFSPTNGVTLNVAQYSADLQAQVQGLDLYVKDGDASSTAPWRLMDAAGQAFTSGYNDDGDDSHYKTFYPSPPTTNTAVVSGTVTTPGGTVTNAVQRRMMVVCQGYVKILSIGAPRISSDPVTGSERILVEPDSLIDIVGPGHSAWPLPNPWYEVNGRRYTVFFVTGERGNLAIDNRASFSANVCGYTEDGSEGAPMLEAAFYQCFRFLNDFVLANGGKGYENGNWPANVTWPGSTTIEVLNYESFEACQEYSRRRMGDAIGFRGNIYIGKAITLREFLRRFAENFDCFFYANQHGQICCGIIDELADLSTAQPLRHRIEIRGISTRQILDDMVENKSRYVYSYHPDLGKYRAQSIEVEDTLSQARHPGGPREVADAIELEYHQHQPSADSAMRHRQMRLSYAPRLYTIDVHYAPGIQLEIGQYVLVTHPKVNGIDRPMMIMRHKTVTPKRSGGGYVTLVCLDLGRVRAGNDGSILADGTSTQTVFADGDSRGTLR